MPTTTIVQELLELENGYWRAIKDQDAYNEVAIVADDVHEDLSVDGELVSLEAADTSTWVRRNGSWVGALHTESLHRDPYGRDRSRAGSPAVFN